jgi:uncharacterized membrane protein (UPF0127 family)
VNRRAALCLALAGCTPAARPLAEGETEVVCRGHALRVELALDEETRARGLRFRRELAADGGMLLVLDRDAQLSLWMMDTFIPLSVAFLDGDGRVVYVADMDPFDDVTAHRSAGAVRYALAAQRGWFTEHGVGPGDRCDLQLPR